MGSQGETRSGQPLEHGEDFEVCVQFVTTRERWDERELLVREILQMPGVVAVHVDGRAWMRS